MKKVTLLLLGLSVQICTYARSADKAWLQQRLAFCENKGQVTDQYHKPRTDIQFSLSAKDMNVFVGNGQLHYQFARYTAQPVSSQLQQVLNTAHLPAPKQADIYRLDVTLAGANLTAATVVADAQTAVNNYYTAGTGTQGITGVHSYQTVTYKNIYPNIDWVLYVSNNSLKYDFVVHAGGHVSDIKLQYDGSNDLQLLESGNLRATTPYGNVTEQAPYSYQMEGRQQVASKFTLQGNIVGFETNNYNGELVIDPGVQWATYYGGDKDESSGSVTCDTAGYVYMSGTTNSLVNIATTGSHQFTYGGGFDDAFLVKFDSTGARQWATYYGGSTGAEPFAAGIDEGEGIACDHMGHVYMSGLTFSSDNIATPGSFQPALVGGAAGFLVQFNTDGIRQWATYYGGALTTYTYLYVVACDANNNVYAAGQTDGGDTLVSPGAHQTVYAGMTDGLLVKFNSAGVRQWGTFYGGDAGDDIWGLAIDQDNNAIVTGQTSSANQIVSPGNSTVNDLLGMLAKFSPDGAMIWGQYTAGSYGVICDKYNDIYIGGFTQSPSFTGIATPGSFSFYYGEYGDAFLMKYNTNGIRQWGTYYGGELEDDFSGLASDANGHIYISGRTMSKSSTIPYALATPGSYQDSLAGDGTTHDAYVAQFDTAGKRLWATYYGGTNDENVNTSGGLACDKNGAVYLIGSTNSTSGIATTGSYQDTLYMATRDAFLVRFVPVDVAIALPSDTLCIDSTALWVTLTNNGRMPCDAIKATYVYTNNATGISDTLMATTTQALAAGATTSLTVGNRTLAIGTYTVQAFITHVTDDAISVNDTVTQTIVVKDCNTGVKTLVNNNGQVNIYPNPTSGLIQLSYSGNTQKEMQLSILNVTGQQVFSKTYTTINNGFHTAIDLSKCATGMYLIRASLDDTIIVNKAMLQ